MQMLSSYNSQQLKAKYEEYVKKHKDALELAEQYRKTKDARYAKAIIDADNLGSLLKIYHNLYQDALKKEKENEKKDE